jgi:hypothetical protein
MGTLKRLSFLRRPKVFIPLVVGLFLISLVILAIKNLNTPAVGSVSQTPPTQAAKTDPYSSSGSFSGKYVSFQYPAHYKTVPTKLSGGYLEVVEYHTTDISGKQINIGVSPGSVSDNSGVIFRRQHKELYQENDSRGWVEFTKLDGTEETFFISHNSLLASVSLTAPYKDQSGDALFVASSLRWTR